MLPTDARACPSCGAVFCYCDQEDARPAPLDGQSMEITPTLSVAYPSGLEPGQGLILVIAQRGQASKVRHGTVGADYTVRWEPRWPWLRAELPRALARHG